jgi:hypothetical protein
MALEYRLTLAGTTPVNQIAERALPEPDDRPTGTAPLLSSDLQEKYGFDVIIRSGQHDYVELESDDGMWVWEPATYVSVAFRFDKEADLTASVLAMLAVVRRVLDTGPEDCALGLNDNVLVLARFDGRVTRRNQDNWWSFYPAADQLFPGS